MLELEFLSVPVEQAPMDLLLEADPSESQVMGYLKDGICFVARRKQGNVGVYVLKQHANQNYFELMNIAVAPDCQKKGIGRQLLNHAISEVKNRGAKKLSLGTGSFGYQLSFYQRAGFRVDYVERDFFLQNYKEPVFEDGIQHKDMLRLSLELA